jgi:hypothetical protein
MEGEHFLKELWQHKAEEEHEPEFKEAEKEDSYDLYLRFLADTERYPALATVVAELKDALGRYAGSVARMSHIKHRKEGSIDKEDLQSADRHRRLMHNNLISVVNRLSRTYRELGIDNKWRSAIIGESREELGAWALEVSRKAINHDKEVCVTLNEFAALCQRHSELAPLWECFSDEAHKLVANRVRSVFFGDENNPELPLFRAQEALEAACSRAGVECPDLSFRSLKDWILRY